MPEIMTEEAEEILAKLLRDRTTQKGYAQFRVEVVQGGKHTLVKVWYGTRWIGQYGLQRGSKSQWHGYICDQLYLSKKQAIGLAKCPFSLDNYAKNLIDRGEV